MRTFLAVFFVLFLFTSARADQLEDGKAAVDGRDYQTALKLIQPLADQGIGEAQELLAEMYFHGAGVKPDDQMCQKWYAAAVESYRRAAEHGDAGAQVHLGKLYERSSVGGLKQDYTEALKWFRMAADHGNAQAELEIGTLYSWGWGVEQNADETLKWWHASAEHGNAEAQMQLGQMYNRRQNYAEAFKWWSKGAEQDDGYSQINLAQMYNDGHGVEKDPAEALRWIRRAADHGFGNAQSELAGMYATGIGVQQNWKEAYFWSSLDGAQNHSPGFARSFADKLTPEQMAEVDIRVKEWKPTRIPSHAQPSAGPTKQEAIVPLGHPHLPEEAARPLTNAKQVTLYSLDDGTAKSLAEPFHGYPVLGKTDLIGEEAKAATGAFQDAVIKSDGEIAPCFEPHHALRILFEGHTYDYLLCYTCRALSVYKDNATLEYQSATGSPHVLNALLTDHQIPISSNASSEAIQRNQKTPAAPAPPASQDIKLQSTP